MTTKLTLSIDEKVIEKAKRISRQQGKSLSKMVEEYLDSLSNKNEGQTSVVQKLSGILKDKVPADVDWKKEKMDYLKKKYDL